MQEIIDMSANKINFIAGNSNLQLAKELGDHIKKNFKDEDLVFEPVHIITPNKAQHNWLKEQLAAHLGFIANLEQHSLNTFFKQCTGQLFPEKRDLPSRGRLVWELFSALNKEEFKNEFPKIATYCGDDEIKRLALAQKVAGLFGEYEQYKPELLQSWKDNQEDETNEDEAWQACLYRLSGFDQTLITATEFKERLLRDSKRISDYKEIFLFGDLQFTPLQLQYLEVLQGFSEFRIHIFRSNLKLNEKNFLVQQWGNLGGKTSEDLQKLNVEIEIEVDLPPTETDLQKIKQEKLSEKNAGELGGDDSLLIYNSFTKLREVEALYNYLVKTVDEADGKLGARDIAVYMPQLDPYIPAIKTVFDTAPHKFPYTLVSKGFSREEGFWSALEQVLDFEEENFTAPEVFNLLESAPIQKSFGFSSELDLLRKAFLEANIRREYKGREELETHYVSFSYGLERLMYGFCLGDETPVEIEGRKIYPVDLFEGAQAQDLFRLYHLVEKLQELLDKKKEARSAAEWHKLLMQIAEDFLSPEEWQEQRFSDLIQNLVSLETSYENIAFKTFYHRLKDHLQQQDVQQIRESGGIVFSRLYPGQSTPKKVVAFLGLNFKEFPRKSQELSFDLLSEEDRIGSGDTDRGAFLQAFLNAEEKVLLSYIGQNVKDNSEIPASSIISELQDYAEKKGNEIAIVKHPLHSFNSNYFDEKKQDLFTYIANKKNKVDYNHDYDRRKEIPGIVSLRVLESFLKDPFRHHYNKVLDIYFENPENLPEWELFEMDTLSEWILKDDLLNKNLKGIELNEDVLNDIRTERVLKSSLPLKVIGEMKLEEIAGNINNLWQEIGKHLKVQEKRNENFELDFEIGNKSLKLTGELTLVGEDTCYIFVSKAEKKKYELVAYIRLLILNATGLKGSLHYCCFDKDGNQPFYQKLNLSLTVNEAKQRLKEILQLYIENHRRIIPFYPELNFDVAEVVKQTDAPEEEKALKIKEIIDGKVDSYQGFYPSDYFVREHRQGFFEGDNSISRLNEFQKLYSEIFGAVDIAFDRQNKSDE